MDTKNYQSLMRELKEKLLDVGAGFLASIQQSKENISRYQKRTHPGFEILGPANQDYYQFAFFERHLEGEIRDNLVYPSLEVIFALFGMPLHKVLRDDMPPLVGFRNDGYEKHQHLEFWFEDSQGVNGCRYTEVDEQDEDFIDFIGKLHINHIYVINWKDKRKIIESQMITEIDVRSFLDGYFGEDISATIVEAMRLYVNAANRIMGFQTIKDYSMQNIYEFKSVIKRTFYSLPYTDLKYIALNQQGREESYIIGENDKKHIDTFFRNNKLHEAFFGRKGFSKCFLTSEYLFGIFKEGQCFDYTSVVCGYMKALEQLIYEILLVEVNKNPSRNIYIKFNNRIKEEKKKINEYFDYIGKNKVPHIAFLPQLKDYFDISMKPMINLLEHHRDIWRLSFNGQKAICEMLSDFCNACRNDHFHKDNILEYSDVVAIRNNTIMLFYLLLGSCKLGEKEELYEALGVQLGSFSEFYSELSRIPRSQSWFILEFKSERINAMRMFNQPNTKYDKEDGMENSIVLFTKVEEFQNENDNSWLSMEGDKNTIIVTKDYFPDKVWLVVRGTNENRLVFSKE